jgi:nitrogen fixation protein FixH
LKDQSIAIQMTHIHLCATEKLRAGTWRVDMTVDNGAESVHVDLES